MHKQAKAHQVSAVVPCQHGQQHLGLCGVQGGAQTAVHASSKLAVVLHAQNNLMSSSQA